MTEEMNTNGETQELPECAQYSLRAAFSESNQEDEKYQEMCQQAVTMIRAYSDAGDLAVVDCYGPDERIYPVVAAIVNHNGNQAILPIARIFTEEDAASENYVPVIAAENAH